MSENVNLTELLYKHLAVVSESTFAKLEKHLNYNPETDENYYKKMSILEYECFIFSLVIFVCILKKKNKLKKKDEKTFENILDNLIFNYKIDYRDLNEYVPFMIAEDYITFGNRMDIFESLILGGNGIDNFQYIVFMFFFIINYEFKHLKIIHDKLENFLVKKMDIVIDGYDCAKIIHTLFKNVYSIVNLFFNDGFKSYTNKEMNPSAEFLKNENELYKKYIE